MFDLPTKKTITSIVSCKTTEKQFKDTTSTEKVQDEKSKRKKNVGGVSASSPIILPYER